MPPAHPGSAAIVITGATSPIGRALAEAFARRGHSLVLVANDHMALERQADDLGLRLGVDVIPIVADLADEGAPHWIANVISDARVRVFGLVATAPLGRSGDFMEADPDEIRDAIARGVAATTVLTRLLLPEIIAVRGILVHFSSPLDEHPSPRLAVHAATHAFMTSLTEAIWQETRGTGVRVLAIRTGPTTTDTAVGLAPSPAAVVERVLAAVDSPPAGPVQTVGSAYRLHGTLSRFAPRRMRLAFADRFVACASRSRRRLPRSTTES